MPASGSIPASGSGPAARSVTSYGLRRERYRGREGRRQKPTKQLFHMRWLNKRTKAVFLIFQG
jgi:hypothetical protein